MKLSRKHLLPAAVTLAVLTVLYFVVKLSVLDSADELDAKIATLRKRVNNDKRFNKNWNLYSKKFKTYASQTLGLVSEEVSNLVRDRLIKMIDKSGMSHGKNDASSFTGKTVRDVYQETGWKFSLIGRLDQAVNMLYLLQNDPYVHKIDGLMITPTPDGRKVKMDFRYITTVIIPRKKEKIVTANPEQLQPIPALKRNKALAAYAGVGQRNLFRPYIPKPKSPPVVVKKPTRPKKPTIPSKPRVDWRRYKLTNLSQFGSETEIHITDIQSDVVKEYQIGDELLSGKIVMVDYRAMPHPDQPELNSYSRLIVQIGKAFYAIELGQTLDQRYKLSADRWPAALKSQIKSFKKVTKS